MRKILVPRLTASAVTVLLTGLLPFPANAGFITFEVPGGNHSTVSAINDAGTVTGPTTPRDRHLRLVATYVMPTVTSPPSTSPGWPAPSLPASTTPVRSSGTTHSGSGPAFYAMPRATSPLSRFLISPGFLVGVFVPYVNDAGTIAGNYSSLSNGPPHGFLRDAAGNITTFDPPGSSSTQVGAINNAGTVLGSSNSPSFPNFLRAATGNFSTFSVPGSDSTLFGAINNAGTVAGTFVAGGLQHGFLRDAAGNFTTFDIPGAKGIGVEAINDLGIVA